MDTVGILKKMKVKTEGVIVNAPEDIMDDFKKVGFVNELKGKKWETAFLFILDQAEYNEYFESVLKSIAYDAHFWLCYPKGTSKIKTDINRDILWKILEARNLSPVFMVSMDNTWSAMRIRPAELVKRKEK